MIKYCVTMNTLFVAKSTVFCPGFIDNGQELSDEIIIPAYYLNLLMDRFEDDEKLYINIVNVDTNQSYLVAIGSPHSYDKNTVFAPQWILDIIGCSEHNDSIVKLQKAEIEDIPCATKITIKPLDPMAFEIDTVACFEKAFMNLNSITEGITVPITVPELGDNYVLFAHIEKVEPEATSLIIEGEVNVDFINEFAPPSTAVIPEMSAPQPQVQPSEANPVVEPQSEPPVPDTEPLSLEERRRQVRESWAKRTGA
jgi:hypothetical protein